MDSERHGHFTRQLGRSGAPAGYDAKPAGAASCFIPAGDRTSLYYPDWGSGRPVLFVHSWGFNADLWQYQMIHLTGHGLRCVAFDRRGHGRSSDPGRGYTCDRLADDLAAVIEQLDLRDVTLVGHSMGCAEIVRYLARRGAGRVSSLVVAAPSLAFRLKTPDNPDGAQRSMVDDLCARMTSDLPQWLAENARPFFTGETSYPMAEWGMNVIMQSSLKALVECVRVAFETDLRVDLPKIAVPTLIVHGDKDVCAPRANGQEDGAIDSGQPPDRIRRGASRSDVHA
jgi:pimeloyl-ACP methyl ester carboxylesterase